MSLDKCTVTGPVLRSDGTAVAHAIVTFRLSHRDRDGDVTILPAPVTVETDADGNISVDLWPNARGLAGTIYTATIAVPGAGSRTIYPPIRFVVPDAATASFADIQEGVAPPSVNDALQQVVLARQARDAAEDYRDETKDLRDEVMPLAPAVETVSANITAVNTAAARDADIATVAARDADIHVVVGRDADIGKVAAIDAEVGIVAGKAAQVEAVAAVADDVEALAPVAGDVTAVAGIKADVEAVAAIDADVSAVAAKAADVSTVAGAAVDVSTVAGIAADVTAVAGIDDDVSALAPIAADITTAAANIADIQAAPGAAVAASGSADLAAAWAEGHEPGGAGTKSAKEWATTPENVPLLGVNTVADATNRLAVKSDAVLLSHDDTTPGTGDMRLKLNKASAGGTASLLYHTGWSGRAEFGLAGDDDFHVKVSANGSTWREAIIVSRSTGAVSMPLTPPLAAPFNLLKDAGRFAGSPEPQSAISAGFTAPAYFGTVNGSSFAAGPKFIFDNATYGGAQPALDVDVDALVTRLKDVANTSWRRYGVEFYLLQVTAGSGTAMPLTVGAATYYLCMTNTNAPVPAQMTVGFHLLVKSGTVALFYGSSESTLHLDGTPFTSHQLLVPADGWRQVTRLVNRNPRQFVGYNNTLKRLYASPGTVFYLAAPFFTPGHVPISPGLYYGVVPSLEVWR